MHFTTIQRAMCNILPDLVLYLFTFICSPLNNLFIQIKSYFTKCLDFIKLCTHDFSSVTFAKLSTNLVYNSIFVLHYDYIFCHLLFFIKMKLSIFSRLCLTHKRVTIRLTHRSIEILH